MYLEKCCVDETGVIIDDLEQEHLEGVAVLIFGLCSRVLPRGYSTGNELEDPTTWKNRRKNMIEALE